VSGAGATEGRLAELGLTLPDVAPPLAAYVPAVRDGDLVWTSGQVPMVGGSLEVTGKVGDGDGLVTPDRAAELARTCALNALAAGQVRHRRPRPGRPGGQGRRLRRE
jgi:hypothetical protein